MVQYLQKKMRAVEHLCKLLIYTGLIWTTVAASPPGGSADESKCIPFRLAVSESLMTGNNRGDVRAVLKALLKTVAVERGMHFDSEPHMMSSVSAMAEFGRNNSVDMFCLLTSEFWHLRQKLAFDSFLGIVNNGRITEEYVLVIHQDSGMARLDQLKGGAILMLNDVKSILARIWLNAVLMRSGLKPAAGFFKTVTLDINLSKVVLPVFFKKADACLITRDGFALMEEMNPQVGSKLKIIAASEPLVPWVFAMRAENTSPYREDILEAISKLDAFPAGRQVLMITKADRIERYPLEYMNDTMAFMKQYYRLSGKKIDNAYGIEFDAEGGQ